MVFDLITTLIGNKSGSNYSDSSEDRDKPDIIPEFDEIQDELLEEMEEEGLLSLSSFKNVLEEYEHDLKRTDLESIEDLAYFLDCTDKSIFEDKEVTEYDLADCRAPLDDLKDWNLDYRIVEEVENLGKVSGRSRYFLTSDISDDKADFYIVDTSVKSHRVDCFIYASPEEPADDLIDDEILEKT